MRTNWTKVMWVTVAAVGISAAACGGKEGGDKPNASAEPATTAAPANTPAPAATSAAPAASAAPADTAPPAASGSPEPEPSGSAHAGGKHHKGEKGEKGEAGGEEETKVVELHKAHMEFKAPKWDEKKSHGWTLFYPKDKTSVLGFVEFEKPGESTKRLGELAVALELTDLKWGKKEKKHVGPEKLEAQWGEASCKVATNKKECELEYYAVEGAVLIAYAAEVDVKAAGHKEKVATKTIETLKKVK